MTEFLRAAPRCQYTVSPVLAAAFDVTARSCADTCRQPNTPAFRDFRPHP